MHACRISHTPHRQAHMAFQLTGFNLPFKTDLKSELLLPSPVFLQYFFNLVFATKKGSKICPHFPCAKLAKLTTAKGRVVKGKQRFSLNSTKGDILLRVRNLYTIVWLFRYRSCSIVLPVLLFQTPCHRDCSVSSIYFFFSTKRRKNWLRSTARRPSKWV